MGQNTSRSYLFTSWVTSPATALALSGTILRAPFLALMLSLFSLAHCTSQSPSSLIGSYPFQEKTHDITHIVELTLSKSDPTTDDHWFAVLEKKTELWKITRTSDSLPLLDTEADEILINHLLDTLKNTQIHKLAPHADLETLGLAPPRFSLRWNTQDEAQELFIGITDPKTALTSISLDSKQIDSKKIDPKIYLANGALFQMIKVIDSFQTLRKLTWSRQRPDPMEALQVFYRHHLVLSAERNGDNWISIKQKKSGKKPFNLNLDPLLMKILSTQALQLIDDPNSAEKIRAQVQKNALYQLQLTDIHGKTFSYELWKDKNKVYGVQSERPKAVFQLSDEALTQFLSLLNFAPGR